MKKVRLAVTVLVIAAGSFATFSLTNADTEIKTIQSFRYVGNDT